MRFTAKLAASANRLKLRGIALIAGFIALGIMATVVADVWDLDRQTISEFYSEGGPNGGWLFGDRFPWCELYEYGNIPTLALVAVMAALLLASIYVEIPRGMRKVCWVVILTVLIGPGIIVNGILKPYWGRPRPADVVELGGNQQLKQVWPPNGPGCGKSFSCGHCAMAFGIVSLGAFYPWYPSLGTSAVLLGLFYGLLMGVARMAQGGHFPTDVLWSGIIVFVVFYVLYYYVFDIPEEV